MFNGNEKSFDGGHKPNDHCQNSYHEKSGSGNAQQSGNSEEHEASSFVDAFNAGIQVQHVLEIESAGLIEQKAQKKKSPEKAAVRKPELNEKTSQCFFHVKVSCY